MSETESITVISLSPADSASPYGTIKDTDLGELPADWGVVALGDVADINMGQSPPSSTYNTSREGLPFLQGKAEFGPVHPNPVKWCSAPRKVACAGSVLVSVRAPVGDVNLARERCCIGRGLAALDGGNALDNEFLFYQLAFAKERLDAQGAGSTFKSINKSVLQQFPIALPPLPEQRAIAHTLRTVQRAKEATEAVIAAARELKRSLMRYLFTYGPVPLQEVERVRLKETEIGPVPEHWAVVQLGSISTISTGTTPSTSKPEYYVGAIPFIKTSEIANNVIVTATTHVSGEAVRDCHLKLYEPGTLLLAMYGQGKTRGQASLLGIQATTTQNTAAILPGEGLDSSYLWLYLLSRYDALRNEGIQGHIPHLNLGYVNQLPVPVPPLHEQRLISRLLLAVANKLAGEESCREALNGLLGSLLRALMTGQLRPDPAAVLKEVNQ